MSKLEDLQSNSSVQGILPNCLATVVITQWFGSEALEIEADIQTGAPENVVRTITENSRSLKFTAPGFEEG
jgi:hypothetical protein